MELLSPSGNYQKALFAFNFGADAVYMGSGYSLRKSADNPFEDIIKTLEYAKLNNKKVYLATNILFHNKQIDDFKLYLETIAPYSPDAFIVSDFAMIKYISKNYPKIDVHVSTQASVTNYETASLARDLGAKRIIPSRELHIDEIIEIKDKAKIEIELFCHGAMCMAYSGRCMLSAFMTQKGEVTAKKEKNRRIRDANQGDCAHPCRWDYYIVEKYRPNEVFTVTEENNEMKIFNSKDLCLIKRIDELKKAGIDAIKIEGRMKSAYYVAVSTMAYRDCIGNGYSEKCFRELDNISHRPFTEGFLFSDDSVSSPVLENFYSRKTQLVGTVEEVINENEYFIDVHNKINNDDELEVIGPDFDIFKMKPEDYELTDTDCNKLESATRHTRLILKTKKHLNKFYIIRKRI